MIPLLPAVIRYDQRAQRGVPRRWRALKRFLHDTCGHDFPVLARVQSSRARRAIASMSVTNLDPRSTIVGIDVKVHAGAVFAAVAGNNDLADDIRALARHHGIDVQQLEDTMRFAHGDDAALPHESVTAPLLLARAAASTRAAIDSTTIAACRDARLTPPAIIEVVTWLAVLQMLHRLSCYLRVGE